MKASLVSLVLLAPLHALASDGAIWLSKVDRNPWRQSATEVPPSKYREVVASMLVPSLKALESRASVSLSEHMGAKYAGGPLQCQEPEKPVLVRAVVGFPETGRYAIMQFNRSILVEHGSLGSSAPSAAKSALVVCLAFEPTEVLNAIDVAE
eukprot:TRINITY_DN27954_c0_g1_i4.p2 TRINITY_DN27954_c0_g1~~TRINITY_DN27954_c0_g1_i4.p2  ORF type:complete len:152 (+),score=11.87 TRINITY_DN27954_c0_g1_i4:106-561(+)